MVYFLKKLRSKPYQLGMVALVSGATLLRLILIYFNWPITQSDESVMDLMALHIAYRGEHPFFYYGQNYMAPIEAYIGAVLFHLFGVSAFIIRLALLPFFALFLVCMYYLTAMLYSKRLALVTVALLSLGSSDMLTHQLLAIGGYPEMLFFAALIFLLAVWLVRSRPLPLHTLTAKQRWQRRGILALLGLVMGIALWDDQLILPFIFIAGLLLLIFCWRELLTLSMPCFLAGLLIGLLPLIIYNIGAQRGENSLDILLYLHRVGAADVVAAHITTLQQIIGVLLFSIPIATGFNPCQRITDLPLFAPSSGQTITCTILQGGWSAGFIALWFIAVLALSRDGAPIQVARFLLLMSAAMSLLLFITSNAAALYPVSSSRYLIGFLLVIPAVLWPLWKQCEDALKRKWSPVSVGAGAVVERGGDPWVALSQKKQSTIDDYSQQGRPKSPLPYTQPPPPLRARAAFSLILLLLITTIFLVGTITTFTQIPAAQAAATGQQALTRDLLKIGATRIYTDYWTCNRIIFESRERILCATLNPQLGQGYDRYQPYRHALQATPHPTFLFPSDSPLLPLFEQKHTGDTHYRRLAFDGYVVYQYASS